jgi:chromatin segregation and condensation protein Rec8/ScpA/Scc1 (kleisin family)
VAECGAPPLLRLGAFEGRLDWLLELARARKVDLARPSLVEVADQLILALDAAAARERNGGEQGAATLPAPE